MFDRAGTWTDGGCGRALPETVEEGEGALHHQRRRRFVVFLPRAVGEQVARARVEEQLGAGHFGHELFAALAVEPLVALADVYLQPDAVGPRHLELRGGDVAAVVQEGAEGALASLREPLSVHGSEREPSDHDLRREWGDRRLAPRDHLVPAQLLLVRDALLDRVERRAAEQIGHRYLVATVTQLVGERHHAVGHAQRVVEQDHLSHHQLLPLDRRCLPARDDGKQCYCYIVRTAFTKIWLIEYQPTSFWCPA